MLPVSRLDLERQLKWFEAWTTRSARTLDEAEKAEASAREDFHNQKEIVRDLRTDVATACARVQYRCHGSDAECSAEASEALAAVEQEAVAAEAQFRRLEVALEEATSRAYAATVTLAAAAKTTEGLRRMLVRLCTIPSIPFLLVIIACQAPKVSSLLTQRVSPCPTCHMSLTVPHVLDFVLQEASKTGIEDLPAMVDNVLKSRYVPCVP